MTDTVEKKSLITFERSRGAFAMLSACGVVYGIFGAWLVTAGPTDPVVHTARFLSFLVSPWMLATYALMAAFIAFGFWRLRHRPSGVSEQPMQQVLRRRLTQFAIVLVGIAAALIGIGTLYLRDIEASSFAERASNQQLIARMKAQQIDKWVTETTMNAEAMAASIARMPLDLLPGDQNIAQLVGLAFGETLARSPDIVSLTLFSPNARVLVHEGEDLDPDFDTYKAVQSLAATPAALRTVDLHNVGTPPKPRMALIVRVGGAAGAAPVGWLAIGLDPFRGPLRNFGEWPTPSKTSEVMLVHRVGDNVVYIAPPLRLPSPVPPNTYSRPLTTPGLLGARALTQGPGVRSGIDYRGVDVFSTAEPVNGLPWIVGTIVDEAEYRAPIRTTALRLAVVISASILLAAVCVWVLYRGERSALENQALAARASQQALARRLETMANLARDIFYIASPDGRIVQANQAAGTAYGYPPPGLIGTPAIDLLPDEERAGFGTHWQDSLQLGGVTYQSVHRRHDGTLFPVEVRMSAEDVEGQPYRQVFVHDISGRRALEQQVARLSRVHISLLAAYRALLHSDDESAMYARLCDVLVHEAGYRMAAVAMRVDDEGRTVRYPAIAGNDDGYLAQANITWGEGPRGRGPLGTAIRTGQLQVNQDFVSNPLAAPWRDEALRRGYRSSIAVPLKDDAASTFAVLVLYATEHDAFDEAEVSLLTALAEDLAFSVGALHRRQANRA